MAEKRLKFKIEVDEQDLQRHLLELKTHYSQAIQTSANAALKGVTGSFSHSAMPSNKFLERETGIQGRLEAQKASYTSTGADWAIRTSAAAAVGAAGGYMLGGATGAKIGAAVALGNQALGWKDLTTIGGSAVGMALGTSVGGPLGGFIGSMAGGYITEKAINSEVFADTIGLGIDYGLSRQRKISALRAVSKNKMSLVKARRIEQQLNSAYRGDDIMSKNQSSGLMSMITGGVNSAGFINDFAKNAQYDISTEDSINVMAEGSSSGYLNDQMDVDKYVESYKKLITSSKRVMNALKVSRTDAIKAMSSMSKYGIFDSGTASIELLNMKSRATVLGIGVDDMMKMKTMGANTFGNAGFNSKMGANLIEDTMMGLRNSGVSTSGSLAKARETTKIMSGFMSSSTGASLISGIMDSNMDIDRDKLNDIISGNVSYKGLIRNSSSLIKSKGALHLKDAIKKVDLSSEDMILMVQGLAKGIVSNTPGANPNDIVLQRAALRKIGMTDSMARTMLSADASEISRATNRRNLAIINRPNEERLAQEKSDDEYWGLSGFKRKVGVGLGSAWNATAGAIGRGIYNVAAAGYDLTKKITLRTGADQVDKILKEGDASNLDFDLSLIRDSDIAKDDTDFLAQRELRKNASTLISPIKTVLRAGLYATSAGTSSFKGGLSDRFGLMQDIGEYMDDNYGGRINESTEGFYDALKKYSIKETGESSLDNSSSSRIILNDLVVNKKRSVFTDIIRNKANLAKDSTARGDMVDKLMEGLEGKEAEAMREVADMFVISPNKVAEYSRSAMAKSALKGFRNSASSILKSMSDDDKRNVSTALMKSLKNMSEKETTLSELQDFESILKKDRGAQKIGSIKALDDLINANQTKRGGPDEEEKRKAQLKYQKANEDVAVNVSDIATMMKNYITSSGKVTGLG